MVKTPPWLEIIELKPENFERLMEKTTYTLPQLKRMLATARTVNQVHMFGFADLSQFNKEALLVFRPDLAVLDDLVIDEMVDIFVRSWTRQSEEIIDGGSP